MLKKDVIKHFGSQSKTARALRISNSAVSQWPEELTDSLQYKVELATNGVLKSSETIESNYVNVQLPHELIQKVDDFAEWAAQNTWYKLDRTEMIITLIKSGLESIV